MLSGGRQGLLHQRIIDGKLAESRQIIEDMALKFKNRFYIELQRHNLADEDYAEGFLVDYAYDLGIPLVATNDCHFKSAQDFNSHEILLSIGAGTTLNDPNHPKLSPEYYYKSPAEMEELFADLPEALEQTSAIAKRCSCLPSKRKPILPSYTKLNGRTEEQALAEEAQKGLEQRLIEQKIDELEFETYRERLKFELGVIHKMGFDGYFLIVYDFINYARSSDIPVGPGRGSGAGSLVAYALRITDLNPLPYGLLFERFLNPERVSMPDFDIDFCQDLRDQVIEYVWREYGDKRVAQIITFGSLQAKAAVRDVGRVLGYPYPVVDAISKLIPTKLFDGKTKPLKYWLQEDEKLKDQFKNDEATHAVITAALSLEGLYRNSSTHAAGVVIAGTDIADLVPIYSDGKSKLSATQYSMKYVESAGLVKFDFLGLRTLSIIKKAVSMIKERTGIELAIDKIATDDAKTFQMLKRGQAVAVFQFEGEGMRDCLRKMRADRFEDLIAAVALYRPGPMENIPTYIRRKHGDEPVEYDHPVLEPVLKETFGIPVYQEQVMQMAQVLAGYSLGAADLLRRAMGKKIKEEMIAQRTNFVDGCKATHNIDSDLANRIFDTIDKFSGYGFNKSHAAAYAWVSYQTAYLKAHYPYEFMAASMSYEMNNTDKLAQFKNEVMNMGIVLSPPNINESESLFSVAANEQGEAVAIRYALGAIKNVGESAPNPLVLERKENGPYKNIWNFLERNGAEGRVNKKILENFAKAGAFDAIHNNRRQIVENIPVLTRYVGEFSQENQNQDNLFGTSDAHGLKPILGDIDEYSDDDKLKNEFESLGLYVSSHPLQIYNDILVAHLVVPANEIADENRKSIKMAGIVTDIREMRTKKGKRMAIVSFSDQYGAFECTLFEEVLFKVGSHLKVGEKFILTIAIDRQENGEGEASLRLTLLDTQLLEEVALKNTKGLRISIDSMEFLAEIARFIETVPKGGCPIHLSYQRGDQCMVFDTTVKIKADQSLRDFMQLHRSHIEEMR